MRRRAPRPLAEGLAPLVERWAPRSVLAEVQRAWPQAVGPAVAAAAEPVREHRGVITVRCASAVWAQELELLAPGLVERLNATLGRPLVTALRPRATGV